MNEILEKLNVHLKSFDEQIKNSMKDLKDKVNGLNPSYQSNIISPTFEEIMKKSAICTTK